MSLTAVPELPKSIGLSGCFKLPIPIPLTVHSSFELISMLAPNDFIALIVQLTSELLSRPFILLSPIAKEDNITHL